MPELPEVEAVVRTLRPLVQGQRIRRVRVFHPVAVKPQKASRLADLATNRSIERVDRKGKYVLLVLDRGLLTVHFRLDGQLVWFLDRAELLERANIKAFSQSLLRNPRCLLKICLTNLRNPIGRDYWYCWMESKTPKISAR